MEATGQTYTAALSALRGPDAPAPTSTQGEPAMEEPRREPATGSRPVEGTSIPVLPARHIPSTVELFDQLGFDVRLDETNEYAIVRRGSIELHFTASPALDPWTSNGMAFVRLDDVDALYDQFRATGAVPLVPGPGAEPHAAEAVAAELRARWDAGESIARMGQLVDQPWGTREFPLLDPSNNLIRFGQVLLRDDT
jgi:hypothetical protein